MPLNVNCHLKLGRQSSVYFWCWHLAPGAHPRPHNSISPSVPSPAAVGYFYEPETWRRHCEFTWIEINVSFLFLNLIQTSHGLSSGPPLERSRNTGRAWLAAPASEPSETVRLFFRPWESNKLCVTYSHLNDNFSSTDSSYFLHNQPTLRLWEEVAMAKFETRPYYLLLFGGIEEARKSFCRYSRTSGRDFKSGTPAHKQKC
jgi:hypothetical protein